MIKILKTMLSDITPKSFKSFFEGIALTAIILAILAVVSFILLGIIWSVSWLFAVTPDAAALIVMCIMLIGLWINSAYERNN
jgi:hypothetical protein